jgi:RNA polymerase sigma factor (sigma-70 family)
MSTASRDAANLVTRAASGDRKAWDALVEAYGGLIWSVTRSYRLSGAEAADVSQTTWLRLCENIGRLRDPACVGAWLATTARRECLSVQARRRSVVLVDDIASLEADDEPDDEVDTRILHQEQVAELRGALHRLPARLQEMLELLMQDDPPTYEEVAATMHLPLGSIGPTRGRALRTLRRIMEAPTACELSSMR